MTGLETLGAIDFILPADLEASATPEERGLRRDGVRLLVATIDDGAIEHHHFTDLPALLGPGDVLVVNTSATLPAAVPVETPSGPGELHLSTCRPDGRWTVELRHPGRPASTPWLDASEGMVLRLPGGAAAQLLAPSGSGGPEVRLWVARLDLPQPVLAYLAQHGRPIRYHYVDHDRPIAAYQTVFADQPGSAEMPSAARPFSAELVTRLVTRGVGFAPFVLHTGVVPHRRRVGRGGQRRPEQRSSGDRRRDDGRADARDRRRRGRTCAPGTRLDRCGGHAGPRRPGGRRLDHRMARAAGFPPGPAGGRGRADHP
jgi:S-adenosylmethionine:tRNA-ribosyltransferase-isomerase (queuine synthetase)